MVEGCFENGIEGLVEEILPDQNPWQAMEALIELGALICTKSPCCDACPCKDQCYAHATGKVTELTKHKKSSRIFLFRDVAVFLCRGAILVKKSTKRAVMEGLYEFPYVSTTKGGREQDVFLREMVKSTGAEMKVLFSLSQVKHSFTKYQTHLYPMVFQVENFFYTFDETVWCDIGELELLPFSAGHRRVLMELLQNLGSDYSG
jgi:A/G-specific adenine glycosylase